MTFLTHCMHCFDWSLNIIQKIIFLNYDLWVQVRYLLKKALRDQSRIATLSHFHQLLFDIEIKTWSASLGSIICIKLSYLRIPCLRDEAHPHIGQLQVSKIRQALDTIVLYDICVLINRLPFSIWWAWRAMDIGFIRQWLNIRSWWFIYYCV